MPIADWVLLGLVVLSTVIGLWRGFIKEVFALAVWVAAFFVASTYSDLASGLLESSIELPSARTALGFGGLFILVLVVGGLLTWLIGKLVEKTGLTGTDRLLGAVFGALRGVLLIIALIIVGGFTPLPEDPWWETSRVIQSLLPLAEWASDFLPESIQEYFDLYRELPDLPELPEIPGADA